MGSLHQLARVGLLSLPTVVTVIPPTVVAQSVQQQVTFPFRDARDAGADSVRFTGAQLSNTAPVVVLFGASTPSWRKARAAIRQAIAEGYPVAGAIMGPTGEAPSLEVFARGQRVTNPINLAEISEAEITRLVRDVSREYFPR